MTGVLKRRDMRMDTHRAIQKAHHVMMGTETGVMLPQTMEPWGHCLQEEARKHSHLEPLEVAQPRQTLTSDFWPPEW